MRGRRPLVALLVALSACGGAPTTEPTLSSPTPTVDLAERARHSFCLDVFDASKAYYSSLDDLGGLLARQLDTLATELDTDAELFEEAGSQRADKVRAWADRTRQRAQQLRADHPPGSTDLAGAAQDYRVFVEDLRAAFERGLCDEEFGE